jgi:hypothetical protein
MFSYRSYLIPSQNVSSNQASWLTPIILGNGEVDIERLGHGWRPAWAKVSKTPFQPVKMGVVACTCHLSNMESIIRRIVVQSRIQFKASPGTSFVRPAPQK